MNELGKHAEPQSYRLMMTMMTMTMIMIMQQMLSQLFQIKQWLRI